MQTILSLRAMYDYDNTLFDNLSFPSGIDRQLAIDRIINKSEEFEVVYSDFDYLKDRIGIWSDIWQRTFQKWIDALNVEYEPLYNYDRYEKYDDVRARGYNDTQTENSSSVSNTVTGSNTGSKTEQDVSAYDSAAYSDNQMEDATATSNQFGSGSSSGDVSRDNTGTSNEVSSHDAHLYGNIGVTTSQQMLRDELDVATWNLYEHISDIFIDEFCILVY